MEVGGTGPSLGHPRGEKSLQLANKNPPPVSKSGNLGLETIFIHGHDLFFCISDPRVKAALDQSEAVPVGAEGGRFSVSPVNGDRPGNLLMQKDTSDTGRLDFIL